MTGYDGQTFAIELARMAHADKAEDVVALDVRGRSQVTDFTVIATGTSERQMRATADHAVEYGKKLGRRPLGFAGYDTAGWIVVDFVDVVLHIFNRHYRDYYDLDLLWGDAPRLAWARSESA